MGDLKLNTLEVKKYMDEQDGCAVIHGSFLGFFCIF